MTDFEPSDPDYDRFGRLVAGELSHVERAELEAWAASDADHSRALRATISGWEASRLDTSVDVDAAWHKLKGKIDLHGKSTPDVVAIRGPWWRSNAFMMRAAAAVAVVAGGSLYFNRDATRPVAESPASPTTATYETRPAERRTIQLSDGSEVKLGVASALVVAPGYGSGTREVALTGEAYFTVTHDEARPFRVLVRGSAIEDLGTEFTVRGYPDDSLVTVAVTSGSVAVQSSASERVVLEPRDVAEVGVSGAVSVARDVDVAAYSAFADGRLAFNNVRLSQALPELQRWYDVEFRISDPVILGRFLNVEFDGQPLEVVLQTIGMTLGISFERSADNPRVIQLAAPVRSSAAAPGREQVGGGG